MRSGHLTAGFWVGDWLVEPSLNRMTREDEDVAVEPKVMEVLVCLAEQPGRTVTKDYFFETVWSGMVVTEDVLSRCISELRKNLGDDSRDPHYIETIRKTGYRLL
ncbi:MAG TPA: winged helix-turn-helix domain-containing protein, partial [Rhodothermales bacterium]|nr:winged helix-turn-helix domain-containing protein [Rhodothermales bacterium]